MSVDTAPTEPAGPAGDVQAPRDDVQRKAGGLRILDQFGFRQLVSDYLIPVETNSIWYSLGGVLAISLALEIVTGLLLTYVYVPDARLAYGITANLLASAGWAIVLNFHYYNAYLIFGLVMVHMVRVFISGGYRGGKTGLWLVGVGLAGLVFVVSLTGEALHWDEVGFGVPWNIGEVLNAIGLAGVFNYATDGLTRSPPRPRSSPRCTRCTISIVPIAIGPVHHLALPADPLQGHLGAVLAARQRTERLLQRASAVVDDLQRHPARHRPAAGDLPAARRRESRRSSSRPRRSSAPTRIRAAWASSRLSPSAGRAA